MITLIDAYSRVEKQHGGLLQYNDEALLKVLKMGAVTSQELCRR